MPAVSLMYGSIFFFKPFSCVIKCRRELIIQFSDYDSLVNALIQQLRKYVWFSSCRSWPSSYLHTAMVTETFQTLPWFDVTFQLLHHWSCLGLMQDPVFLHVPIFLHILEIYSIFVVAMTVNGSKVAWYIVVICNITTYMTMSCGNY